VAGSLFKKTMNQSRNIVPRTPSISIPRVQATNARSSCPPGARTSAGSALRWQRCETEAASV